jgi:hypothetical protein
MADELRQAVPLSGVEVLEVLARDQSELGDGQQPDHG